MVDTDHPLRANTAMSISTQTPLNQSRRCAISLVLLAAVLLVIALIHQTVPVSGFIKFGYILNTTACDTCDELRTYSGRNVFCCLAQSKCCGPNSLDELDASLTTVLPTV